MVQCVASEQTPQIPGKRRGRIYRVESNKSGLFFLKLKVVWFSEKTPKLKIVPAM